MPFEHTRPSSLGGSHPSSGGGGGIIDLLSSLWNLAQPVYEGVNWLAEYGLRYAQYVGAVGWLVLLSFFIFFFIFSKLRSKARAKVLNWYKENTINLIHHNNKRQ